MSRFVVVDLGITKEEGSDVRRSNYAVVDTDEAASRVGENNTDLGVIVWHGEAFDRDDLDASWTAARAADVEANRRNVEAPADRQRPTEPPPSIELTLDSVSPEAVAHGAEA